MNAILSAYALPARANNGELKTLGNFKDMIEPTDTVRFGATGITVVAASGTATFFGFSKPVLKGLADGTITKKSLGNLVTYASHYKDAEGKEQSRLKLGVPQGHSGAGINGADFIAQAATEQLVQRTVSFETLDLAALIA